MEALADRVILTWRRVVSWFRDDFFRRLFLNAGKLLSANVIAAAISLVATMLTARALGPERYGILALVLVYELMIAKLVTFNAWQAVIKFGSEALERDDRPGLRQLVKFGFCLDVGSAIVGTILALLFAGPVVRLLGWDPSVRPLLVLYSVLILFSLSGTPIGVLRLFDRFDLLSYTSILNAVIRLLGVVWCVLSGQNLSRFVLVYLITGIVGQLYQAVAALWVLRRAGVGNFLLQSLQGLRGRYPAVGDYVWATYLNSTVVMTLREGSAIVIAGLTSPAALGLYKIAQQIAHVLPMLSDPLYQATYPELARLWTADKRPAFFSLIRRTAFLVGGLAVLGWLGFVVTGRWLIARTAGPAYDGAYLVTVVYMLAFVIGLCGVCLQPAMLAMGLPRKSLVAISIGTGLYFVLLFPLIRLLGITGASAAYVGYYLTWMGVMMLFLRRYWVGGRASAY